MARLAKSHVHEALEHVAATLIGADGGDGRISRADMRRAVQRLRGLERTLTEIFFRFVDHRDAAPGAVVTRSDVEGTLRYAKDRLIDAYDFNENGLSKAEIAKMSNLGKLAVALARERMIALHFDENDPLPTGYTPTLVIDSGTADASDGVLVLTGMPVLGPRMQSLLEAALWAIWERVLVHRYWNGPPKLEGNGRLEIGEWTDPRNDLVYVITHWVDIDD
ncbi:MAG: hypothetical protein K0V04_07105, partial [Deltaproteobacteria bacterium]|nr:hypothetical protein [Deltaproteobacteria bacterium]